MCISVGMALFIATTMAVAGWQLNNLVRLLKGDDE